MKDLKQIIDKFYTSLLQQLNNQKLSQTWYLWFPWPNILFIIIATNLVGQVSLRNLFELTNQSQIFILVLLMLFSIIKSCLISIYVAKIDGTKLRKFNIWLFIGHLFPSFFFIWIFYWNWNTWNIVPLFMLDLLVCFLANWLIERKVQAHIFADLLSISLIVFLVFLDIDIGSDVAGFVFVTLFVTLRYLLITSFYRGINIKNWFSWNEKQGTFYWFSELFSSMLFMSTLLIGAESISEEASILALFPSLFIYYIFLYLRLFLYKQYGISYRELYYFLIISGCILFYIWILHWIDIDIVVWFLPAAIILFLDDFIYFAYKPYTNRSLELSLQGKQLFAKLKLFSLLNLFIYHVFLDNKQRLLCYELFGFSFGKINNVLLRDYFLIPFVALILSIIVSITLFKIANLLIYSRHRLINKYQIIISRKYKSSKRLSRRR